MKQLVKNISCLAGIEYQPKPRLQGKEMATFNTIDNAWLLIEDGRIAQFGSMADGMPPISDIDNTIDAEGGMVLPSWCDSHTHIVYAGSREREFVDKINGLSYEEIAKQLNISLSNVSTMQIAFTKVQNNGLWRFAV